MLGLFSKNTIFRPDSSRNIHFVFPLILEQLFNFQTDDLLISQFYLHSVKIKDMVEMGVIIMLRKEGKTPNRQ